ncbi:arginyl-tRNA synthetase [Thermodesulfatator indicus DSM 15286]|uniref:Arginine--tRNA ligase n=1 Tax=Thermodesulfatator indicus (strain DSM 15286 / JCM 11887 / CIR29812) TaxID=667014 RepID=F8ACI4_THEID|nr:arginine--tRNA ligase [Thermodesulfatator indicus]AEH44687.1 arginyl-tRNA synthetase [Thermodesulfatator indicus DSM 15286]
MIAKIIYKELEKFCEQAKEEGILPEGVKARFQVEPPKNEAHGDYATNIALSLAGQAKKNPRELASWFVEKLNSRKDLFEKIEIAGPGFINFFIAKDYWQKVPLEIEKSAENYGACDLGSGRKFQVEFVSANPTGPLHIGHGRGAAVGDTLARILAMAGFNVEKEYYINDVGRQMLILGRSVYLRAKELSGEKIDFPEDHYRGEYIIDIARSLLKENPEFLSLPEEEAITLAKEFAVKEILAGIKKDLEDFGVVYDQWFSEKILHEETYIEKALSFLKEKGLLYEKDGAIWFKAKEFGDEKDRVVIRASGEPTYFASDIAYHYHKFLVRGFDEVVDIWGADHHGYVPRMKAVIKAFGLEENQFKVILIQMVNLLEGGKLKSMSTRAGEFVTLRELIDEVGKDATRFIFLTRRADTPLDFDVELAKKQSRENPVYYVQYAHARLASLFRKAEEAGLTVPKATEVDLGLLNQPEDFAILKLLDYFPDTVEAAATKFEPHLVTFYLLDLATALHDYYTKHRFLSEDLDLTKARLVLAKAVKQVLKTGLNLLGVSAPERM